MKIALLCTAVALVWATNAARAQDPVKVDTKHYKVEFENDQVRVLRVKYDAGEKSPRHSHPNSVAVFLTDEKAKFTYPDGTSKEVNAKTGDAQWIKGGAHEPENVNDKALELILVEVKGKAEKPAEKSEKPDKK